MFALPGKNLQTYKMSFLVIITVGRSSMQFFPSLLLKNNRILSNDSLFSSFYNSKRLHRLNFLN